jgi:hypothetical protein
VNSYIFFRRIRWPILLLTFGVTALLNQWDILHFDQSWPLYLVVFGVLRLAEGAALASASAWPAPVYPAVTYAPGPMQTQSATQPQAQSPTQSPAATQGEPVTPVVPVPSYPPSVEEES